MGPHAVHTRPPLGGRAEPMVGAVVGDGSAHFHCGWIPAGRVKLLRTCPATPRHRHSGARPDDSRRDSRRMRSAWGRDEPDRRALRRIVSGCVRGYGRSRGGVWHERVIGSLRASSRSLRARQLMPRATRPGNAGANPNFFGGPAKKALCYGFCFHTASPLFSTPTIHECGETSERGER